MLAVFDSGVGDVYRTGDPPQPPTSLKSILATLEWAPDPANEASVATRLRLGEITHRGSRRCRKLGMPGIAELALAGAPIAGGALLGIAAGNLRGPDVRGMIKQDIELLDALPAEQVERRAELQRVIDIRIDDLIAGVDKSRSLREIAASYGATGATSWCSSARSCSPSSGGTSATAGPTG